MRASRRVGRSSRLIDRHDLESVSLVLAVVADRDVFAWGEDMRAEAKACLVLVRHGIVMEGPAGMLRAAPLVHEMAEEIMD